MQLEARTTQRQEQRLLPQMLQSIEVLQLATADLLTLVVQQLETNEVLELEAPSEPPELRAAVERQQQQAQDEWDAAGVRPTGDEVDGRRALLENQPDRVDAVLAAVREQIAFRDLPRALADAVLLLAERLDERGWLLLPLTTVAADTGVAIEVLRLALGELQAMEPRGLGAATGVEAMLLQAVGDPDFALIERLLTQHLDELARNKLPDVARTLQVELDDLHALLQRVAQLSPTPAAELRATAERSIAADVHVWLADGVVEVALADDALPHLSINSLYEQWSRDRTTDKGLKEHLRERVRAANDLIFAIAHRQSTLRRVAEVVMRHQRDFLVAGRRALRPLRMAEIARELDLHPSTISRAIAGKYVATPFGTLPLRDFCEGGSADGKDEVGHARSAVAQHVAELVQAEDKSKPLSDDALVEQLAARGIQVARRTVTKLRQAIGIASSYRRRQHGKGKGKA